MFCGFDAAATFRVLPLAGDTQRADTVVSRYKRPIGTGKFPAYIQFLFTCGYKRVLLIASGSQKTLLPSVTSYQGQRNIRYQIDFWFTSVSLVCELLSLLVFLIAGMHPTRDLLS